MTRQVLIQPQTQEMVEKLSAEVRSLQGQLVRARQGIAMHAALATKVAQLDAELRSHLRDQEKICEAMGSWDGSWIDAACARLKRRRRP